tara:strand:+ start:402 stop:560 length:159 start_codon:yes stop_codon:yes gene_type:complete
MSLKIIDFSEAGTDCNDHYYKKNQYDIKVGEKIILNEVHIYLGRTNIHPGII